MAVVRGVPRSLLRDLERPGDVFAHVTPNWFAAVMGTGIVAVTASTLPTQFTGLHAFAVVMWVGATLLLLVLAAAFAVHWLRHTPAARSYVGDPVIAHFYGALPMAILVVGAGVLLLGRDALGIPAAVDADWVLWLTGTALGLVTALGLPSRLLLRPDRDRGDVFAGWLMPVVPPMVSSATGALLVPHAAAGAARVTLLVACYAMFALSAVVSGVIIGAVLRQIARNGPGEPGTVPTLWIVLGPLGQSIAAANLLGAMSTLTVSADHARELGGFGLGYGVTAWVLALLWTGAAVRISTRAIRVGMPFSLSWWSFTFPVGTLVSGTSTLADHTGSQLFRVAALVMFACLVAAWAVVAARTVRACVRGWLFLSPAQQAATTA